MDLPEPPFSFPIARTCARPGVRAALPDLHRACEAFGRDPGALRIIPFGTLPDAGKLEYYESIGINEVVLRVPTGDENKVLPILDTYAPLAAAKD